MEKFYITAIDAGRVHRVAGPYADHDKAKARVGAARDKACEQNQFGWFFKWGTSGSEKVLKTALGPEW